MSGTIGKRNTINLAEPPYRNTQQIPSQKITTRNTRQKTPSRNTQQIPSQKITPPPRPQKQPQEKINCKLNTKGIETYIYHFDIKDTKETIKATCWNKVVYVYLSVKQDNALNQFKKLFNKCQPHNILIYITGFIGHPYTEPPEADIKNFIINNTHDFLNVTIINKVKSRDIDDFFQLHKDKGKFKKVINILPYATQDDQKFYDERTSSFRNNRENTAYVNNVNENLYYTFMKSTHVRDSTYNPIHLSDTTLDENGLPNPKPTCNPESPSGIVNEWWYQYYFDVPPCAYGRFLQSAGTCWMNAILNTIILTPKMAEIAVKNFYDDKMLIQEARQYIIKNIHNFSDLHNEDKQIRTLLFGMIYLLFIKGVKAQGNDKNFVASIGARVKGLLSEKKDQFHWKETNMSMEDYSNGSGGSSGVKEGFLVVLPILFKKDIDYTTIDDIDTNKKYTYTTPIIIDIPNIAKSERIAELIGGKYKLEAGGIILSWAPHAVAGLKCDDKFYIYDSDQKIAYDDWNLQDTTHNYIEKYKDHHIEQSNRFEPQKKGSRYHDITDKRYMIEYAIYIKEGEPSFLTRIKNTMNTIKNTMNPWRKKGGRKKRKTVKRKINHPR